MLSSTEASHIFELLKCSKPITVNLRDIRLSTSYDNKIKLSYDGEKIESRDMDEPEELNEYVEALENLSTNMEYEINGWEYIDESESLFKWVTSDENALTIENTRKGDLIVSFPLPFDKDDKEVRKLDSAKFVANLFLIRNDPKDIDYKVCRDITAHDVFQEIAGVGEETARKIIRRDIYSYEDLLNNSRLISRQYRSDAKEQINERMENDEIVLRDDRLLDEFSDYMAARKL